MGASAHNGSMPAEERGAGKELLDNRLFPVTASNWPLEGNVSTTSEYGRGQCEEAVEELVP